MTRISVNMIIFKLSVFPFSPFSEFCAIFGPADFPNDIGDTRG